MADIKKRRQFTLEEKIKIIAAVDSNHKKGDVAKAYGITPSTLSTILKDRKKIDDKMHEAVLRPHHKRMHIGQFEDVDTAVFTWLKGIRAQNIPVSGPLLREKAVHFANRLGHDTFQGSVGWLNRFRERYSIASKIICGEENDVPLDAVTNWREGKIRKIIAEYNPNDIFNADETGLFYQLLPYRTLAAKGDRCRGGKKSKLRITALFCCNATGTEKLRPLIIGKSANPRCFKNVHSLPCEYRANTRSWMTTELFNEWLIKLDVSMKHQKRKILMIVDNCSAHNSPPRLTCIQIEFLPPNCTAVLQPLDQGIISSVKAIYRSKLLKKLLINIEKKDDKKIDIKEAIDMTVSAWNSVTQTTVVKCWHKTHILSTPNTEDKDLEITDDPQNEAGVINALWRAVSSATGVPAEINFDDFIDADNDLLTSHEITDDEIIASVQTSQQPIENESNDEDDSIEPMEKMTISEALTTVEKLRYFLCSHKDVPDKIFENLSNVEEYLTNNATKNLIQKKITDFI